MKIKTGDIVAVSGCSGVAFRVDGPVEHRIYDPETEEFDIEILPWLRNCHMIGDDRNFVIDTADMTVLDEDDYCGSCGQIGCGHG